jgi:hypothetical protein
MSPAQIAPLVVPVAYRSYFGRLGKFSENMMLICERFRLVEISAPAEHTS